MAYHLTKDHLRLELHSAFVCAKQHKSKKPYVVKFAKRLDEHLDSLCDDLWNRNYIPEPSTCFIVEHPKKREVFAAQFRDRVVHHLYYNMLHQLYERTLIADCYSCIPGRGTHFGIERLKKHIRKCSHGYQRHCHVLKLDKRGYFMHIDRKRLADIACDSIKKMSVRRAGSVARTWGDVIDVDFALWLTHEIALLNPKENCRIAGSVHDWDGLDHAKSLFYTIDGRGLPIGNLTSQLFSNVNLNPFDQFMKRVLHCEYYGRYVDDSYVVDESKARLNALIPPIEDFLGEELGLELNQGKIQIHDARHGVEFLGAFIKPDVTYISNASLNRMIRNINDLDMKDKEAVFHSVNSFLGILSHYASFNIRCQLFLTPKFLSVGRFDSAVTKFELYDF